MPRRIPRIEWTKGKHGGLRCSIGERGLRITLFQKRRGGTFNRAVWLPGQGWDTKSLKTQDRDEAEQLGRELQVALLQGQSIAKPAAVTLERVWERYESEAPTFAASTESTQDDARGRAAILLAFFGAEFEVAQFMESDVRRYEATRRAGGIQYVRKPNPKQLAKENAPVAEERIAPAVRARTVDADLVLLNTMLRWATTVREPSGERWLKENPLVGIRRPREPNPKRPVATRERFSKTREAMQQMAAAAESEVERQRWVKMELALVLAEGTGRRLGSIRQLRWEDIDLLRASIRWRAESDKKRRESVIPLPARLVAEIKLLRARIGAIGEWVFARESDGKAPMDRHLFDKWLWVAEKRAKLSKLSGGLWHPYRRKWATERKFFPLKDVAAAGGWVDIETLFKCYTMPDPETLLLVMEGGQRPGPSEPSPEKREPQREPITSIQKRRAANS